MAPKKPEQSCLLLDGPSQGETMSNKVWLTRAAFALASFGILPWTSSAAAAEPKVSPEDLRPGLITTYRDPGKTNAVELNLPEPAIALALKKGDAPHPRLRADGGTVRWQGYVNILRAGPYRFSAILRGKLRVTVGGKEMLAAEVKADTPTLKQDPEVRLDAGVHALTTDFARFPGAARVELFWQAPHFHCEPLPYDVVFHLPAQVPARVKTGREGEHGFANTHRVIAAVHPLIVYPWAALRAAIGESVRPRPLVVPEAVAPLAFRSPGRVHDGGELAWRTRSGLSHPLPPAAPALGKSRRKPFLGLQGEHTLCKESSFRLGRRPETACARAGQEKDSGDGEVSGEAGVPGTRGYG
jgi:hypothetical protein